MKKKSAVTRLTVGRLYNLGNYEHVRYEITAEVPKGGSAKKTLLDIGAILAGLKPQKKPYDYAKMKDALAKLPEALSAYEKDNLEEWRKTVTQIEAQRNLRMEALDKLDAVGGVSEHKDAKRNWQDSYDDDCPW